MKLKELRKQKGLSQYALSEKSGVSQNYISELENGKYEATEEIIIKLCLGLEVDPNTLLDWRMSNFEDCTYKKGTSRKMESFSKNNR